MNVSDLSTMEVNVEVNESDIVRIHMDDEAEIEVDAYLGETFSGRVTEIGNTALNAGMNGFSMDQVTNFLSKSDWTVPATCTSWKATTTTKPRSGLA